MSEKLTSITREFTVRGDVIESPEGFRVERVPTLQEKMDNVIQEIKRIEALKEPTDREKIAFAEEEMDYYRQLEMLEIYKADLKNYEKLIKDASDNLR